MQYLKGIHGHWAMPLDPNRFYQKRSSARQAILHAVEWSAIAFTGMLAVLFLSWALALQLPSQSITTESTSNLAGGTSPIFYLTR